MPGQGCQSEWRGVEASDEMPVSCALPCHGQVLFTLLPMRSALLAAHPEVQEEMAAELEAAGLLASRSRPQPRRLTYANLSKLPYLDAVRPCSMEADQLAVSVMSPAEGHSPLLTARAHEWCGGWTMSSGSQVVKESMRMCPVSASGLGRCTREPTVIGGYLIPAGCEVQVSSTHTHIHILCM